MKHTHFNDIAPNNRTEFTMLYFAAMYTIRKLEAAIKLSTKLSRIGDFNFSTKLYTTSKYFNPRTMF